jgi:8-oxo-dGTP diphosphatase
VSDAEPLHVLVGLIRDARGRWLVNQRRPGTDLAGFWEFPGGKRHADESPLDALRRELGEELGIDVLAAEPWLELVHDYPEKTVRLDVWRVLDYRGEVDAREGQALDWVAAARLAALPLLPADLPIVEALLRADASLSKSRARSERPR